MHNAFEGNPFSKEKGDCTNNPRPHTFVTLSSASAISNENVSSTAIFNGNSKNTENSMQSSDGIPSAHDISAKSEVDTAQRTESSCSNSYFIHPVCSSNDNYQETSIEEPVAGISVETKGGNKVCNKQDNSRSLYPKGENLLPSESLMIKHVEEENEVVDTFDLNDDFPRSALNNHKQLSSSVIRPMAKLGVPLCLPISTQKFGGELGWRGTAATSAFCLVPFAKTDHSSRDSRASSVIDLNLVADEDCQATEFPWTNEKKPTVLHFKDSSSYSGSKQEEKFSFDLNAPGDDADDCPRSSFPVNFTKGASMDLNLNDDPCDDHIQLQRNQTFGAVPSLQTKRHPREHLNILGSVYRGDLNHMQQVFNRPFLVAAPNLVQPVDRVHRFVPVQPQLSPYAMQVVPSYCYPSNGSFLVAQADSLATHNLCYGTLPPCTRDPRGHAVFPRVVGPTFPGAPYLLGPVHASGGTHLQPGYDINSGDFSLMNGSRQQLLNPGQNTEMKFSQQPTKRREPEGGWDAFQLGLKHTPSSH